MAEIFADMGGGRHFYHVPISGTLDGKLVGIYRSRRSPSLYTARYFVAGDRWCKR